MYLLHVTFWLTASQNSWRLGVLVSWRLGVLASHAAMKRKAEDIGRPTQQFKHIKWHRATQRWAVELPDGSFTTLDQKGCCFPSEEAAAAHYAQAHGIEKSSLRRGNSSVQASTRQFKYVYWHAASHKWSVRAPKHDLSIKDEHGKPFATQRKAAEYCASLLGCAWQSLRLQTSKISEKKLQEKIISQYHGVCRLRDRWVAYAARTHLGSFKTQMLAAQAVAEYYGVEVLDVKKVKQTRVSPAVMCSRFRALHKVYQNSLPGDFEAALHHASAASKRMFEECPVMLFLSVQGKYGPFKSALLQQWKASGCPGFPGINQLASMSDEVSYGKTIVGPISFGA